MYVSCYVVLTVAVVDSVCFMLRCIYSGGSGCLLFLLGPLPHTTIVHHLSRQTMDAPRNGSPESPLLHLRSVRKISTYFWVNLHIWFIISIFDCICLCKEPVIGGLVFHIKDGFHKRFIIRVNSCTYRCSVFCRVHGESLPVQRYV